MPYAYPKYPDAIFTDTDYPDVEDDTTWAYAWHINALKKELQAVESELGINIRGDHDNVRKRIEALEGRKEVIFFPFDGGGSPISTGIKGDRLIPYGCVIGKVTLLADQSGSIVIDIWKDTYANYAPTDADSITASAPPTISAAIKAQDETLTGWTKEIAAGDTLRFNVDSCATIQRAILVLEVVKT